MLPITIRPDQATEEILNFNKKLAEGLENLNKIDSISTGVTPSEIVYQEDKMVLVRYKSDKKPTNKVPLLIVYALVNRPYMTDIQENRSMIRSLLDVGQDVYLIDWGYPDRVDRFLTMDDYINGYLDRCVDFIRQQHNLDKINILGICQGGTFSLCYGTLHADKVRNLVTIVTPVDFKTPDNKDSLEVKDHEKNGDEIKLYGKAHPGIRIGGRHHARFKLFAGRSIPTPLTEHVGTTNHDGNNTDNYDEINQERYEIYRLGYFVAHNRKVLLNEVTQFSASRLAENQLNQGFGIRLGLENQPASCRLPPLWMGNRL